MTKTLLRWSLVCLLALVWAPGMANAQEEGAKKTAEAEKKSGGASDGSDEERPRMRTYNEAKLPVGDSKEIRIISPLAQTVASPDYGAIADTKIGSVVELTRSTPPKLLTDVNLTFGTTVVKTENVAKNYPGVYGLWLKRVEDGWHLVFNSKADVWGTMHDDSADMAEVPLSYEKGDEPEGVALAADLTPEAQRKLPKLELTLAEEGGVGHLTIAWGAHTWKAEFTHGG